MDANPPHLYFPRRRRAQARGRLQSWKVTLRRLLLAAGLSGVLVGPSFAEMTTTIAPSAMHRAASPYSRVVQAVPANAEVDIESCGGAWCYGSWRGRYGFLPSFAVARGAPPAAFSPPPPPLGVTAPALVAPPPVWGGPYVGFGWGYSWRSW